MKLAARLWLLGAGVPMVGILVALLLAGAFFEALLAREVDRALLTQAAVESVSLFDGPRGEPHLHKCEPWGPTYQKNQGPQTPISCPFLLPL
ncbi:hypothetical protein [Melittangium boletus]|uniref:Two-component sensor histidine kinase n=1 Tax=Melittangium boletus DSM 14713 TaxID=1294270 RepID=A0A250ILV5_9BACT|nr:hypothetical protein [Melittangium boletus]ATB32729.1 two-component sensor histidine kinase [Melittangium boletus DSM 14713]